MVQSIYKGLSRRRGKVLIEEDSLQVTTVDLYLTTCEVSQSKTQMTLTLISVKEGLGHRSEIMTEMSFPQGFPTIKIKIILSFKILNLWKL